MDFGFVGVSFVCAVPCRAHSAWRILKVVVNSCPCLRFCFLRFVGSRSERVGYNSNAHGNRVQFVVVSIVL